MNTQQVLRTIEPLLGRIARRRRREAALMLRLDELTTQLLEERELSGAQEEQIKALLRAWRVVGERHLADIERLADMQIGVSIEREMEAAKTELERVDEVVRLWEA